MPPRLDPARPGPRGTEKNGNMQPVSVDVSNLWQNDKCHGCTQLFSYCIRGWLLTCFPFSKNLHLLPFLFLLVFFFISTSYDALTSAVSAAGNSLPCRLSAKSHSCLCLVLREKWKTMTSPEKTKKTKTKNKHIHVQSNVHHIFKHISKSSDFEIISQNKYIFFSQPIKVIFFI